MDMRETIMEIEVNMDIREAIMEIEVNMDLRKTIMEILMLKKHLKTGSSGKKSLLKCSSTAPTSSSFTTLGEIFFKSIIYQSDPQIQGSHHIISPPQT